jgi:toxin ParE1/3/4
MARVIWSREARRQLKEIIAWIAKDAPGVAIKWARKLSRSTDILKTLPDIGSPVEEFPGEDLRELIVGPFRIIYRHVSGVCRVKMVIRGQRDLRRHFDPNADAD